MPASDKPSNVSRKVYWLGASIVTLVGLYSAFWYAGASKGQEWLEKKLASPASGITAECSQMQIKGFPFRAGVFCDSFKFSAPSKRTVLTTGALRTAALVYNPGKAIFELDGPVNASLPAGSMVSANWENFHGSLHAGLEGLSQLSIAADRAKTDVTLPVSRETASLQIEHGEVHTRQNGADLDIALLSNGNILDTEILPTQLPSFSTSLDATINGLGGLLQGERFPLGSEITGTIRRFVLDFGAQGALTLSGTYTLSPDGLLSGDFDLTANDFAKVQQVLNASFPEASPTIDASTVLLQGLSPNGKNASVKLTVNSGTILLGIIPVGFIPPL